MCGRSLHSSTKSFTVETQPIIGSVPSNSQAIWGNCISKDQRVLCLGARCSKHELLYKSQAAWWGHTLSDACGSFIVLSLVICWALGNGIITPYLLLLTHKKGMPSVRSSVLPFALLVRLFPCLPTCGIQAKTSQMAKIINLC